MSRLLILLLLVGVAACSNRAVYENIQIHQRNECMKQPSGPYEECLERVNPPYEEYRREREEMLESQSGRAPRDQ